MLRSIRKIRVPSLLTYTLYHIQVILSSLQRSQYCQVNFLHFFLNNAIINNREKWDVAMKIGNRMILNNLLVGSIPVLLSVLIFILVFRLQWENSIKNRLETEIAEFKKKIETEADKFYMYSFFMSDSISINYRDSYLESGDIFVNMGFANRSFVYNTINSGLIKNLEVSVKDKIISRYPMNIYYTAFETSDKMAQDMWDFMNRPDLTRFFRMTFPMLVSNILVLRSCSYIMDMENSTRLGLTIASFPVDNNLLSEFNKNKLEAIIYTETTNGYVFSTSQLENTSLPSQLKKIDFSSESRFAKVNIENTGEYYVMQKSGYTKNIKTNGKFVRQKIADLGVMYSAEELDSQMASFLQIALLIFFSIAVAVTVVAIYSAKRITVPISDLGNMVIKFRSDFTPVNMPEKIDDEISMLHASFSDMSMEINMDFGQASTVQKSILTSETIYSAIGKLEIDIRYLPMNGKISGDYYDISPLANGIASVMIADVSGHGTQAALSTMQLHVLNRDTLDISNPHERLEYIDYLLVHELNSKNFFTCFLVNIFDGKIQYSSGAHCDQYLIKPKKKKIIELSTDGMLMGVLQQNEFCTREEKIEKGDILILFTDGIFEEFNPKRKEFGSDRFYKYFKNNLKTKLYSGSMKNLNDKIIRKINNYRKGTLINDDITLISIRIK